MAVLDARPDSRLTNLPVAEGLVDSVLPALLLVESATMISVDSNVYEVRLRCQLNSIWTTGWR
jgi:hypothetical protein